MFQRRTGIVIFALGEGAAPSPQNAPLQAGDTSLLHVVVLHVRTRLRYVKPMLHSVEECVPFKGRLCFFQDTLHLFEQP